ncbi:hypothetical protein PVK06_039050 [Gossypium arboreum]|uniref:Uncharacterized protein n=1 Tax=Gossypium arboreum TaxID=29729 RepID=A0ABR0N1T7_GOSAR|nr:hypothetical protein PVK06_039050 [Gossypium arboreum]
MDRGIMGHLVDDCYVAMSVGIVVDVRGLSGRERLFRWSKSDAHFWPTTVFAIKQPINNYNRRHADRSLIFTFVETSTFLLKVLVSISVSTFG